MMDEDPGLVKVARWAAVGLGVIVLVLGVVILEGGLLGSSFPTWGWLLNAVVGGGTMGLGLGLGAAGLTGENRFLERLRARAPREGELSEGESQDRRALRPPGPDDRSSGGREEHLK